MTDMIRTSRVIVLDVDPRALPDLAETLATAGITLDECVSGTQRLRAVRTSYPARACLPAAVKAPRRDPAVVARERGISPAELRALQALASGMSRFEAAKELGLSAETVKRQMTPVRRVLGVHTNAEAIAVAYRLGLVPAESVQKGS